MSLFMFLSFFVKQVKCFSQWHLLLSTDRHVFLQFFILRWKVTTFFISSFNFFYGGFYLKTSYSRLHQTCHCYKTKQSFGRFVTGELARSTITVQIQELLCCERRGGGSLLQTSLSLVAWPQYRGVGFGSWYVTLDVSF